MSAPPPAITETLQQFHITPEEAAVAFTVKLVQEKILAYTKEASAFEERYRTTLEEFTQRLQNRRNSENFQESDDRNDWQFAVESCQYYEQRLREISAIAQTRIQA